MTPDERASEIINKVLGWDRKANEALDQGAGPCGIQFAVVEPCVREISTLVTAAVSEEREGCAKVAETHGKGCPSCSGGIWRECPDRIAAAIRVRGEET